jgi:hypothetical protein
MTHSTSHGKQHTTIFIGDVHGQASTLLALLEQLGWKQRNQRLTGPSDSQLVFVGDLIDRGPENRRTVEIVRELVEQGSARCVLGNHEFNAVQFHTPDPERPGEHLRPNNEDNIRQHRAFLEDYANDTKTMREVLDWFRTLPVAIETSNWRCVHACWDETSLEQLEARGDAWHLPTNRWTAAAREGAPEYQAIEILAKGPEWDLPDGVSFSDKEGKVRTAARLQWWRPNPETNREALLFPSPPTGINLDDPYKHPHHPGYDPAAPPVFFGHYWKRGELKSERPNAACIDYSAGKGDRLVAYCYRGESQLQAENFVAQPVIASVRS